MNQIKAKMLGNNQILIKTKTKEYSQRAIADLANTCALVVLEELEGGKS